MFGTDGLRGKVNVDLTPELALKFGKGVKHLTKSDGAVLMCTDTRQSGAMLAYSFASGVSSVGRDVYLLDVLPTPAVPLLMDDFDAQLGVVISASHNKAEDNGIKFFNSRGLKLTEKDEDFLEKKVLYEKEMEGESWQNLGDIIHVKRPLELYLEKLKERMVGGLPDLSNFKLVVDCANGATFCAGPRLFSELGAELVTVANSPTGFNINVDSGSTCLGPTKEKVLETKSDLGVAFDGDGDRVLMVDEKGDEVDGDRIMYSSAKWLKNNNSLDPPEVVSTVMSNLGLEKSLSDLGVKLIRTQVGDKYVAREMLKRGAFLGGEQSGHIIFRQVNNTGDGIVTALMMLKIMASTGKNLSQLGDGLVRYPQVLNNVPCQNKESLSENGTINETIDRWSSILGEKGRIIVRPSGTEDLIRVMVECDSKRRAEEAATELGLVIEEQLNGK